jgi:outer membrane protein OmpA-like peptidoglycan-associated protein
MIKVYKELNHSERDQIKKGVIQVYGSAMNRTALGIVDAFLTLYPKTTFTELKEVFPDSINMGCTNRFKSIFMPYTDKPYGVFQKYELLKEIEKEGQDGSQSHFLDVNEIFTTGDGVKIMVSRVWESSDTINKMSDLQGLIDVSKDYGIIVVDFEPRKPFKKGKYQLEVINPLIFEKLTSEKDADVSKIVSSSLLKRKLIIGAVVFALLLAIAYALYRPAGNNVQTPENLPTPKVVETSIEPTSLEQISDSIKMGVNMSGKSVSFQNIYFKKSKSDLLPTSDSALIEIYNFLITNKTTNIEIIGHCSEEGGLDFNQKLSLDRATSVVKYLIDKGVDSNKLFPVGKGITEPLDNSRTEEAFAKNRRVQIIIK